jgi:hypothetical protein
MTRRQRLRRVGTLCLHCLRNLALYRAGWRNGALVFDDPFWVTVNGNFLDVCVLEWYKLFGDSRGQHFWQKVITDPMAFFEGLLKYLGLTEADLNAYVNEMRGYRDKFVAHLDSDEIMHIPKLEVARSSVSYLYEYLRAHEDEEDSFIDAPTNASDFYARFSKEGNSVYDKISEHTT